MNIEPIKSKDRVITLVDDINECNVKQVMEKICEINLNDDDWINEIKSLSPAFANIKKGEAVPPIIINLNTYGGSVYDGFGLYDVIQNSETPIEIICNGKIMSMGIILALAAKKVKAYRHTTFMIHSVSSFSFGPLKDLEDNVEESKRLNDMIFDIIAKKTCISMDTLTDIYEHKKNWIITAEDALKYGIINEII